MSDHHPPDDLDPADELLLARLGRSLRAAAADEPPARVLDAAVGASAWIGVDDELADLAELAHDSWEEPLAGVRGAHTAERELTFATVEGDFEVELLVVDGADRHLVGQVVPPSAGVGTLQRPDGSLHELLVDDLGHFVVRDLDRGPFRVVVRLGQRVLRTSWFMA